MKKANTSDGGPSASELITDKIAELGDWRGETLARMRKLIKKADPDVVEEWKWRGTPVWSHDGIICTGESYKTAVKLTFAKGASLKDPAGLFNSSLDGNMRRAIDIHEGEKVDASAFTALVREAIALNSSKKSKPSKQDGIDAYIAAAAPIAQPILNEIRRIVHLAVPEAEEAISYKMPAFKTNRVFFYFAAFKNHIGVYPPVPGDAGLKKELQPYANDKGNLRFPLSEPMPYELIRRVAIALAHKYKR